LNFADNSYEGLFEVTKVPMRDGEGNVTGLLGIARDITERKKHEEELKRKDADLNAAQALAHIGNWRLEMKQNLLEWSEETYRIFGVEIGTPLSYEVFLSAIHPDDRMKVDQAWQEALRGAAYEIEHRILVNGELKWVREHAQLETDDEGHLLAGVGSVQLITERKLYEERLETLANYDPLTGLANRALLLSHLQNTLVQAKRHKDQIALLMFDLDRFKDINDSYGHGAGDELLRSVAERFGSRLREGDLISRLGGDEFAVVLEHLAHPEDAGRLAEEMISTLSSEYKLSSGASIHIGASAGIVLFPDHGDEASTLLQHADAALYKAKAEGRGTYRYYTDALTDSARRRIECETRLRRAIFNNEFEVYYQPQVHIQTGRIVGAEALIRWNDSERGIISPGVFIPIAEETGLIGDIGEWVLNETCRQGKIWLDQGIG
jgi:diguanylate cyclase (GGDEF)-like protein/PAS domain S-box-containing protein